jgi:hypothetical protein
LICIRGVGDGYSKTFGSSDSKEEMHKQLLNAGGICLSELVYPRKSKSLSTIEACLDFARSAISFDNIAPLDGEHIRGSTVDRFWSWDRPANVASLTMCIELSIKGSIPVNSAGKFL